MFDLLFQLSIVFLIIMFTKNIMDMKKYNDESSLVELKEFKIEQNIFMETPPLCSPYYLYCSSSNSFIKFTWELF